MNGIATGGPAFPVRRGDTHEGMTLRDYFASEAMTMAAVLLTSNSRAAGLSARDAAKAIGEASYIIADAMLAAREKGGGQ